MSLPPMLEEVKKSPGMYFSRVEFDIAAAFIQGFDFASSGGVLVGFREWLVVKLGCGSDLTWDGLVLILAFPEAESPSRQLHEAGNEERAVECLFGLLEEFWQERQSTQGLRGIYLRYQQWLRRQDWYNPSSPDWIEDAT